MSRTIIEKTSGKDAVFNTTNVRSEVTHRQNVVPDERSCSNRSVIAQLHFSIDILHQVCAVGIYCPGGTDPVLGVGCWNNEGQRQERQSQKELSQTRSRHFQYLNF